MHFRTDDSTYYEDFFFLRRIIQTGQNETRYKFAYTMAVPRAVDYIIICLYVDV